MPIGVITNALTVFLGGLLGAFLGNAIPDRIRSALPLTLGAASMAMGINYIVKLDSLAAVIFSIIFGSAIGELIMLENGIEWCANRVHGQINRLFTSKGEDVNKEEFMEKFIAILILFSASGTGIFGALIEGMTADHSVLFVKSILDFVTAGIFAAALGYIVMTIAVPQFILFFCLFLSGSFLLPLTTPLMIADFTAVGGIIMLATGFRICGLKSFPVANMLPSLLLVMPISHLWTILF
jgi:uncharacterized membrane protein YqgA involved in biofilm formation